MKYLPLFLIGSISLLFINCQPEKEDYGMTEEEIIAAITEINHQGPRFSPDGAWILYKSTEDEVKSIMKIRTSGEDAQQLFQTKGYMCCYNYSRDGAYITFNASDGDLEVGIMKNDGTDVKQITNNDLHDGGALWTYDNQKLVLTSVHEGDFNKAGIYWMNPDGSDKTRLHSLDFRAFDPSISHSGDYVLAQHVEEENLNIYRLDIATGVPLQLTQSDSADWYPEWSPDDRTIAYRNNESGDWDIYLMNIDGSNKRKVTESPSEDRVPVWSPNGKYIAYQSKTPDQAGFDIWIMDADGQNKRNLTKDRFDNQDPNWSPDGKTLTYGSKVGDYWQVMLINKDGTGKKLLIK